MKTVDAHVHLWRLDDGRHGWIIPAMEQLHRDFDRSELVQHMDRADVRCALLVESSDHQAENEALAAEAATSGRIGGFIGNAQVAATALGEPHFDRTAGALGVRLSARSRSLTWFAEQDRADVLAMLERRCLVLDLLLDWTQLATVRMVARRHPSLSIVLNHCATPPAELSHYEREIRLTAELPNIACKLSGLGGPASHRTWRRQVTLIVLQAFGDDRVIWGSDWPIVECFGGYQAWLNEARLHVTEAGFDGDHVFGGTARHIYGLAA